MMMIDDGELIPILESESATSRSDETVDQAEAEPISVISIAPAPLSRTARLQRAKPAMTGLCVVFGILVAPLLAIVGCVGLALPASTLLHQASTLLLCIAVIGLGLALVMAHIAREELEAAEAHSSARRDGLHA